MSRLMDWLFPLRCVERVPLRSYERAATRAVTAYGELRACHVVIVDDHLEVYARRLRWS